MALLYLLSQVECYGLTMARGGGWMSFASRAGSPTVVELTPNMTGFHVLHLRLDSTFGLGQIANYVDRKRFNIYGKTDAEVARFSKFVKKLPHGDIIIVGISDTAVAAKRPPGPALYGALRELGAPEVIERIGYRFPFCFVGVKGAARGQAALLMGKTKHLLRIETTIALDAQGHVGLTDTITETTDITTAVVLATPK